MGDGGGASSSSANNNNNEAQIQRILSSSPACTNRLCIEFRIQHQKATAVRLDLEKQANDWQGKFQQLHDRLVSRGLDIASREGTTGVEGFTMPNGEIMSVDRVLEVNRMLAIVRSSLQAAQVSSSEMKERLNVVLKEKEAVQATLRTTETTLRNVRVERQFIYTDDDHQTTVQANSNLVDENERLRRQIRVLEEDNLAFKHREQRANGTISVRSTEFLLNDGCIPGSCPCGGCKQYESVLQSTEPMKAFQNHMNHTHRVCIFYDDVR